MVRVSRSRGCEGAGGTSWLPIGDLWAATARFRYLYEQLFI